MLRKYPAPLGTIAAVAMAVAGWGTVVRAEDAKPGTAEAEARELARPHVDDDGLKLRQDPWKGTLTGDKGKAIRFQFFKGNAYRIFFAAPASEKARGTLVHLAVIDAENNVVAEGGGDGHRAELAFTPEKTDMYLVLLRAAFPEGEDEARQIPCALFYGFK